LIAGNYSNVFVEREEQYEIAIAFGLAMTLRRPSGYGGQAYFVMRIAF
jgi:hypothetical protein